MDDRTWSAATAEEATWPIGVWARFSDAILLMENPGKVQLVAQTGARKRKLLEQEAGTRLEERIKDVMEVLGMVVLVMEV